MPSFCYIVQVWNNYANRNADISLYLSLIENQWGASLFFQRILQHSVSKGVTWVLVTKSASLCRLKNDAYPSIWKWKQSLVG